MDPERVEILRCYVHSRVETLLGDGVESDPIKLFIKQEPHKLAKIAEGRLRLISAVSVVDTMIDRMLFQGIFQAIKSRPLATPIAIGWNPMGTGASFLKMHFPNRTFDTDKKHWDWTFPFWLLADCYSILMATASWPEWRKKIAIKRFYCLFRAAVFQFPDGTRVEQKLPGIMKSGCYLTLLLNSLGQWFLHELAERELGIKVPCACFGDDVTQESCIYDDQFVNIYQRMGFRVESESHDCVDFCGFKIFSMSRFLPSYKDKHIFMLKHLTLDPVVATQTLQSYQYLYWFDKPFLGLIRDIARERDLNAIVPDEDILRVVLGQ